MDINNILPIEIETHLVKCIKDKLDGYESINYTNTPIKDGVLSLLDTLCIVVYYPLPNEGNNGFHITDMPFANGTKENFVYINTAQTMEKQVFTAAHELGHIWCVDDIILDICPSLKDKKNIREAIINRFAATLLMPSNLFENKWETEYNKNCEKDGKIAIVNLLKIVVLLMEYFFAPMKAVVLRLLELDIIDEDIANILLGNDEIPENVIDAAVQKIISSLGFIQFKNPTFKKWIEGFDEILDKADEGNLVLKSKIEKMRNKFDLKDSKVISEINVEVSINKQEGLDT